MKVKWYKTKEPKVTFDDEYDQMLKVINNKHYYITPIFVDKDRYNINILYYDDSPGPLLTNSIEFQFIINTSINNIELSNMMLIIHSVEESAFLDIHDVPDDIFNSIREKVKPILPSVLNINDFKEQNGIDRLCIKVQVFI